MYMNAGISAFKHGMIIEWHSTIASIPAGWVLCDGENGTPNLPNNLVIAAGDTYAPGDTDGELNHSHILTGDGHVHTSEPGGAEDFSGDNTTSKLSTEYVTGTTDEAENLPPVVALAFIMKL